VLPTAQGGVQITVRDFGPGVAEAQIPSLGQPFFRPDAARTREGGGVGLGLYLCRLVAQAHGGTLVVSNAKPGLQVQVVLPPISA
jgi:signal transduction histidine kinase